MSKKQRHADKLEKRGSNFKEIGLGTRGTNRKMRRHPNKFGLNNAEGDK